MARRATRQQYVILPVRGLRATTANASPRTQAFLAAIHTIQPQGVTHHIGEDGAAVPLHVVDSIGPDAAKLVEMAPADVAALRAAQPGIRIAEVVYYRAAFVDPLRVEATAAPKAAAKTATIRVVSRADHSPVRGAVVVAFSDFANRVGAQGTTKANGQVNLALSGVSKLERLYVYPGPGFWPSLKRTCPCQATSWCPCGPSTSRTPMVSSTSWVGAL